MFWVVKGILWMCTHYPFIFYERNRGTSQKPRVKLEILCFTYFQSLGKVCLFVLCRTNINHESSQWWHSTINSLKLWGHHELKSDKDVHEDAKYSPLSYHTGSSWETTPWSLFSEALEQGSMFVVICNQIFIVCQNISWPSMWNTMFII